MRERLIDEEITPIAERIFGPRVLLCPPALFEYCRDRYPRREIHVIIFIADNEFNYFNRKTGRLRIVKRKTEVWALAEFPNSRRLR